MDDDKRMKTMNWLVAIAAIAAVGAGIMVYGQLRDAERYNLPPIAPLPSFNLITQEGKIIDEGDLGKNIAVFNFIFTRCPSICPLLTKRMKELEAETKNLKNVRFYSITVDPDFDTPSVLKEYATRNGADLSRWTFLTGDRTRIQKLVVNGFLSALTREPSNLTDIAHGEHFVVVDSQRQIRTFKRVATTEDRNTLKQILRQIAREPVSKSLAE